jgi:cell division protein FtsN
MIRQYSGQTGIDMEEPDMKAAKPGVPAPAPTDKEITVNNTSEKSDDNIELATIHKQQNEIPDQMVSTKPEERTYFTIQAGSYLLSNNARNRFESLIDKLDSSNLDGLRIEQVGQYYTVRLGRFDDYDSAAQFLSSLNDRITSALVLDAYIKDKRIVKLYKQPILAVK